MILRRLVVLFLSEARDWLFAASAFAGVVGCMWLTDGSWITSLVVLTAFVVAYLFAVFFSERILKKLGEDKPSGP